MSVCVAYSTPAHELGAFFFEKAIKPPASRTGCLLSHVRIKVKEEAPPTQLAAVHIYIPQYLLAYTFRAASRPGRGARRGRESLFVRARAGFFSLSRGAGTWRPPTPSFLAASAALQQAILYLCDEVSVVCGLRGWSVSVVCGSVCSSVLAAVEALAFFWERPDRQKGGYPSCIPGAHIRPFV